MIFIGGLIGCVLGYFISTDILGLDDKISIIIAINTFIVWRIAELVFNSKGD